jgi:Stress responsive A/B Barrel Domain
LESVSNPAHFETLGKSRGLALAKILHLVVWQLNGDSAAEREAQAKFFSLEFTKLVGRVPGLSRLDVGPNCIAAEGAWDMGASMIFESRAALEAYATHPAHLEIKAIMSSARTSRAQVDVELML